MASAKSSGSLFSRLSAPTIAASIPFLLWARDNIAGLVRVQGPSMEPTLLEGDIVLVRKADAGLLPGLVSSLLFGEKNFDYPDAPEPTYSRLYDRPPHVRRGQVVVIKSVDTAFPDEWHIKRVWGTPGTWVQVENGRLQRPSSARERQVYRKLKGVPPYSLYVGGDNEDLSRDSRQYGPISQNLLVGIAEYIVWPPSRMRRISSNLSSERSVPTGILDEKGQFKSEQ